MVTDSDVTERVRQQVRPRSRARGESEALVAAVVMIAIAAVWQGLGGGTFQRVRSSAHHPGGSQITLKGKVPMVSQRTVSQVREVAQRIADAAMLAMVWSILSVQALGQWLIG